MRYIVSLALIVAGIIHLLPLAGVLGADRLQALYGVTIDDPNLLLLLRHRAVLFGMLGGYFIAAAFVPSLQLSALVLGLISVLAFLVLAVGGGYNPSIFRVVVADWIALGCLVAGLLAYLTLRMRA